MSGSIKIRCSVRGLKALMGRSWLQTCSMSQRSAMYARMSCRKVNFSPAVLRSFSRAVTAAMLFCRLTLVRASCFSAPV